MLAAIGRAALLALALFLMACDSASEGDTEPTVGLTAPTSVVASLVDANTLEVNWTSVSGASEYKIYMDDNPDASSIEYIAAVASGTTSFTKGDLQASTQYWFWVKACSSSANSDCSGYSKAAEGDTTPATIAPSDFTATAGAGGITFSWSAVESYSYNLLRSKDDCISSLADLSNSSTVCSELKIVVNVAPGVVDSDLDAELTYYYWLEITDNSDNGNRDYVGADPISVAEAEFVAGEVLFSKYFADGLDFAPALDEATSRLYVASGNQLYALDDILGREQWSTPFTAEGVITAAPILDGTGNVYIAAAVAAGNIMYKISSSGEMLWSSSGDNSIDSAGVQDALALIESNSINSLYFANSSGAVFGSTNLSGSSMTKVHTMAGSVVGAMAVDWYGNIFLGDEYDNLVIVSASNAHSTLNIGESLVTAPALDSSQNLYFATEGHVRSYTSSGTERWQSAISVSSVSSSPILDAGGKAVYQADNETLYKIDSSNGSEIWSYNFSGNVYDTTPVVDAEGLVYVGLSREGKITLVDAAGNLFATYSTGKSSGVTTPLKLSSEAKLYFGAGDWLFAMQAEAQISEESPWPQYKGNARNTAFVGDSFGIDTENFYARVELDNDSLIFLEDANGRPWISDNSNFTVGASSMRSPEIDNNEMACIRAVADRSGFLSFFWQVSSENKYDSLDLSIVQSGSGEVVKVDNISGSVDWQQESGIAVNSGEEIRWCYGKDNSVAHGEDTGWLDGVEIQ